MEFRAPTAAKAGPGLARILQAVPDLALERTIKAGEQLLEFRAPADKDHQGRLLR
ncbi:MAG TPA: hypothetical protein VGS16_05390 [Candidatus Dormibacteraeota bacterium]|nr:hypothetical protein [Candidatus Dormibacteraeota bacterium]